MKANEKILALALLVLTAVATPATAETIGTNFDWTVKNIKLSIHGPVVIHSNSNRPRVKVTVSGAEAKKLRVAHDSNTLELGGNAHYENYIPKVEMVEIWTDGLRSVSVYGSSDVDLGSVDVTALDINLYGMGTVKAKRIDATTTGFMLYGIGRFEIDKLDATGVQFALAGQGEIVVREQDVTTINAILSGIGSMDLGTVDATNIDINLSGQGNVKVAGDAVTARLFTGGSGNIDTFGLNTTRTIRTFYSGNMQDGASTSTTTSPDDHTNTANPQKPTKPTKQKSGGHLISPLSVVPL